MGRLIKLVMILAVLGFTGLVGFAYLGNYAPPAQQVKIPVVLNAQ